MNRSRVHTSKPGHFRDCHAKSMSLADQFGLGICETGLRRFLAPRICTMPNLVRFVLGGRCPRQIGEGAIARVPVQMGSHLSRRARPGKRLQNCSVQSHNLSTPTSVDGERKILALPIRLHRTASQLVPDAPCVGHGINALCANHIFPLLHLTTMTDYRALIKGKSPAPKGFAQNLQQLRPI